MEIANASLLDEATAAAEAMAMAHAISKTKSDVLAVATDLHPQTRAVLATRARPIGITLVDVAPGDLAAIGAAQPFALVLQYPGTTGAMRELSPEISAAHEAGRAGHRLRRSAGAGAADAAGRDGRGCGGGFVAALRRADGVRRPACRLSGHARCLQAAHAGTTGRRVAGCRGPAGDAARAADARAAHQAREGDVEHLHLAGAAGGDRRLLRRVARAGGAEAHRAAGEPAGAAAGRCGARAAAIAWCTTRSSTRSRSRPRAPMR